MRGNEGFTFTSATAVNSGVFLLRGGKYLVTALGTWGGGNSHLQRLGPDGSTYLDIGSSTNFTANGQAVVDLPPGDYQFANTTVTVIAQSVIRIPND